MDLYKVDTVYSESLLIFELFHTCVPHGVKNYFPRLWGMDISDAIFQFSIRKVWSVYISWIFMQLIESHNLISIHEVI